MKNFKMILIVSIILVFISFHAKSNEIKKLNYYSASLVTGINYLNHNISEMSLRDDFSYTNKKFFILGGSFRKGILLPGNIFLEKGIDLNEEQLAIINFENEEYRLYQANISLPVMVFFNNQSNTKFDNEKFVYYLGIGAYVSFNYGYYFEQHSLTFFPSLKYENTHAKIGLVSDVRLMKVNENFKGNILGLRTSLDVINLYNKNENESSFPYFKPPLLMTMGVYYNFVNLKTGKH